VNPNIQTWSRQIDAIVRLELKKYVFGRRWIAVYLLALAPVVLFFLRMVLGPESSRNISPGFLSTLYAGFFQLFMLRFAIFFGTMIIFTQLFRGEVLEKTLHYYLLTPVRREVLAVGKYTAGLVTSIVLFTGSMLATYVLLYLPSGPQAFNEFMFQGPGLRHAAAYAGVTMLACLGYGAVFLVIGLIFKNPIGPAMFFLAWESFNFVMPPVLQQISVVHYLQSICPVAISRGPLAVIMEPTSPWFSIPGLLTLTGAILLLASYKIRRVEITYSAD
jgi:ABC-type transport system involved in multi-copper enzyme maturation permease subunit